MDQVRDFHAEPSARARPRGTILIIDDEAHIRELAELVLRPHGFEVLQADGGAAALDRYTRQGSKIDLVILDLTMPEISGWDVLDQLIERDPGVRVLISSGFANLPADLRFPPQVVAVLPKPYRPADLAAQVNEAMQSRK